MKGNSKMRQTTFIKPAEVTRTWYVVDGAGKTMGRLATEVAAVLRGKHKPTFTPNVDCGDFVIVINADKIEMTGKKMENKKYYSHSMYPGGLRTRTAKVMKQQYTVEWVEKAIHGMLPHTRLGDVQRKHLFVYTGSEHPHAAQKPVEMKLKG
ncbi:large subunit ribosomal protein L13 [Breznakia sp. PF5-3]|nr:large subunit ribosomal protein L13 [Breznakia sp. PM6-1]MDF9836008.1 large subunit ribosomal protein L13 [Breznakia sp. PF5-3]MDF9838106.1 large subunit ribosomal protein L13 [Breznakia sp. PFB2-8]MDF9860064.1 large subunit ribosomal protein L13 [Breznakia sp. PH5-24]